MLRLLIFSFLLTATTLQTARATIWRVNNGLEAPSQVDFNELKAAVEDGQVQSGDTIYVEGSAVSYEGDIEINKSLTIIGPGYLLAQEQTQPTLCNQLPARVSGTQSITLRPGSDGTTITGMTLARITTRGVSNIVIHRNQFESLFISSETNFTFNNNVIITNNLVCNIIQVFGSGTVANDVYIANNLVGDEISSRFASVSTTTVINNTMPPGGRISIEGASVTFNYTGTIDPDVETNQVASNILNNNNADNQAIVAINGTNVIDPYTGDFMTCSTDDWRLQSNDATDQHGAFNGPLPLYADEDFPANLPPVPAIFECSVDACGDEIITVSFQVRSNQ